MLGAFDWEARSRVVDGTSGLDAAALVAHRTTPLGAFSAIDASSSDGSTELLDELTLWGVGLSRAAGAIAAQVWRGRGHTSGLSRFGLQLVRPWWRMDRVLASEPTKPSPVHGYLLRDGSAAAAGSWAKVHNLAFADHWRFSPRTEEELMAGRPPDLCLMAVTLEGSPAGLTVCQIESYSADRRPQPVGVVSSVGTLPNHRRRGLATWLVGEALHRLHRAGARHASLYVDGLNPTGAVEAYRKLGFEVAFETEVWEATFR
jgi:ribosomal protein S18 acetylase RimI-like enzyme